MSYENKLTRRPTSRGLALAMLRASDPVFARGPEPAHEADAEDLPLPPRAERGVSHPKGGAA